MFTKIKTMKKLLAVLFIALSINGFAQQKGVTWHTDVNKAIKLSIVSGCINILDDIECHENMFQGRCENGTWFDYMKENCALSCGLCGE